MPPTPRAISAGLVLSFVAIVIAACAPPPGPPVTTTTSTTASTTTLPGNPGDPVVSAFSVQGAVGPAPAVVALAWAVSDPDGDALTCRLDGDGDATFETVVDPCPSVGSRTVSLDSPGARTARLRVEGGSATPIEATTQFTVSGSVTEGFDIELRGADVLDPAVAVGFTDAVERWEQIVVRGVPDLITVARPGCLPASSPDLPALVDDLIVDVAVEAIDGPGGVLGSAGPTCIRSTAELPVHGTMRFDSDDVADLLADGSWDEVIEHELAHVLGFGTIWDLPAQGAGTRVVITGTGTTDPRFTGPRAVAEWSTLGRSGNVPVEATGGPGTRDSHWRETTFDDELMTGWIGVGTNPLSRVSVASLGDLGYRVSLAAADPYALPGFQGLFRAADPGVELEMLRPELGAL